MEFKRCLDPERPIPVFEKDVYKEVKKVAYEPHACTSRLNYRISCPATPFAKGSCAQIV